MMTEPNIDLTDVTSEAWRKAFNALYDLQPRTRPAFAYQTIVTHICYLFSRGGLLVIAGLIGWLGAMYGQELGQQIGMEAGFTQGCRAAVSTAPDICGMAEQVGKQITQLRLDQALPKPRHNHDAEIAQLCADLRRDVPVALAAHYGCYS